MTANSSCAPEDLFIPDESANGSEKIKAKLKKDTRDETANKMFAFPSVLPRCEWNSI